MKVDCLEFAETGLFAPIFNDYVSKSDKLKSFYNLPPAIDAFQQQIKEKSVHPVDRKMLSAKLKEQYKKLEFIDETSYQQIESLEDDKTFTLTTGHQLNIFSGPLYFHFKILTVINACERLNQQYPDNHFVPIYWMASEDHDLDEIQKVLVAGKKYKWDTQQEGAVGRMQTEGLADLAAEIEGKKGGTFGKAYGNYKLLADAVRAYVNKLYGKHGLLVLDADDPDLKAPFRQIMKKDLLENKTNELVVQQSEELNKLGYKTQTYPREINLFYLKGSLRARIVKEEDIYRVLDTDISFTEKEIMEELELHPERFSPNVILRPLYQEVILPNLAYTGGPAEVAYWLQLKTAFDHYQVPFPIQLPRNFGLVIPNRIQRKIKKLKLSVNDLFSEREALKKQITKKISAEKLHLTDERMEMRSLMDRILNHADLIDPTLGEMTAAETQKLDNALDKIEKKMIAAEKRKHSDKMRQVDEVMNELYPENGLQERKINIIPFLQADPQFIVKLKKAFNPFNLQFHLMRWDG